jgi:hypothetical protein
MKNLSLLFALILCSSLTYAQNAFSPDRPGFGYGSNTTAPGMFGLEAGITHSEFGTNIGEIFVRAGLTDAFEIQFEAGSVFIDSDGESSRSSQHILLKHKLYTTRDGAFQLSVLNRTTLPFLNENESEYFTEFFALADFSLSPKFSINSNLGYGNYIFSDFDNDHIYFTINPGYVLTPGTSVYAGLGYAENEFFDTINYEFGIAHLIHPNSQVDLGFVFDNESNPFIKAGIATRF